MISILLGRERLNLSVSWTTKRSANKETRVPARLFRNKQPAVRIPFASQPKSCNVGWSHSRMGEREGSGRGSRASVDEELQDPPVAIATETHSVPKTPPRTVIPARSASWSSLPRIMYASSQRPRSLCVPAFQRFSGGSQAVQGSSRYRCTPPCPGPLETGLKLRPGRRPSHRSSWRGVFRRIT